MSGCRFGWVVLDYVLVWVMSMLSVVIVCLRFVGVKLLWLFSVLIICVVDSIFSVVCFVLVCMGSKVLLNWLISEVVSLSLLVNLVGLF